MAFLHVFFGRPINQKQPVELIGMLNMVEIQGGLPNASTPNKYGLMKGLPSMKLTQHVKMDGWNTNFLLGWPIFEGYVSFMERIVQHDPLIIP